MNAKELKKLAEEHILEAKRYTSNGGYNAAAMHTQISKACTLLIAPTLMIDAQISMGNDDGSREDLRP